jgi:16S rRNA processing protein RimM
LPVGRVRGHRGARGELTVVVSGGDAALWSAVREVRIAPREGAEPASYRVEVARAYRDRLVLKLRGIDDGNAAEALRGQLVSAPEQQAAGLPPGRYWRAQLVGLVVEDESGRALGTVEDVMPTAGPDLLRVVTVEGRELLLPLVAEIVLDVDRQRGRLVARPPRGLEAAD